jgi:hypothetical protein
MLYFDKICFASDKVFISLLLKRLISNVFEVGRLEGIGGIGDIGGIGYIEGLGGIGGIGYIEGL